MQIISFGTVAPGLAAPMPVNVNRPTVKRASKLSIQSMPSNDASASFFVGTSDMTPASIISAALIGVVAVLSPGQQFVLVDEQSTDFQLDALYLLGQNGTDVALVVGYVR
jgi:hypothetical protein